MRIFEFQVDNRYTCFTFHSCISSSNSVKILHWFSPLNLRKFSTLSLFYFLGEGSHIFLAQSWLLANNMLDIYDTKSTKKENLYLFLFYFSRGNVKFLAPQTQILTFNVWLDDFQLLSIQDFLKKSIHLFNLLQVL